MQRTRRVGDDVERLRVMMYLAVEAGEIEAIEYVFFVDLAEVLVALGRQEPSDPSCAPSTQSDERREQVSTQLA